MPPLPACGRPRRRLPGSVRTLAWTRSVPARRSGSSAGRRSPGSCCVTSTRWPRGPGGPLLVVAPSGTGKSSLLGAGLLNALAEGRLPAPGSASWPRLMITPGSRPLRTLRAALATLATVQTATGDSRFVVIIDQLEEIFTVCESEAERSEFFDEIGTLAADAARAAPWWCSACGPTSTRGPPRTRCCARRCSPGRWWWGRCRPPRCGRRSSAPRGRWPDA